MLRRPSFRSLLFTLVAASLLQTSAALRAEGPPRVLSPGKAPNDIRLQPLKDYDGYFPFQPPASVEAWNNRANIVRRRILVSQGLWPMPEKTPLNAVIHGRIDQGDYTVEKVYFESFPGFFVTGNLYRPKTVNGKAPGVLHPHGHWPDGRFMDAGRTAARKEIVAGAERFESGGRSPLQARAVQIARMGCVCFHYDMIGYADSKQLSQKFVHGFAKQRPEMNTLENWGFFSPQSEANLESVMGLQTWNSIRALDFLLSLPEVDSSRIAVSGASGGGTQTMLLAGIDPRVTVAFPAVMVSTSMQGGCTCENASCLRVGTGNIEFAAMFAPKPQGITSANDWTKEVSTKGFPELKQMYALTGAPDNIMLANLTHFPHNYNYVSRSAYYGWLNKHFKLGIEEPVVEEDFPRLTTEQMAVWDVAHPQPPSGDDYERKLARQWLDDSQRQIAALAPTDAASLAKFRDVVGGGVATLIDRELPAASDLAYDQLEKLDQGDWLRMSGLVRNKRFTEEVPATFLHPKQWKGRTVVWLDARGKAALFDDAGKPKAEVQKLVDAGTTVVGVDLFMQGEFLVDGKPLAETGKVANPREFAGYTFGYNDSVFAQRVHDVLTIVSFVNNHERKPDSIALVGFGDAGPIAAAARAQAGDVVNLAAIDTAGFRFSKLNDYRQPQFLPGGAKYGDVPGMLALGAPGKLWLAGETAESTALVRAAHAAAGTEGSLTLATDGTPAAAVEWLLK